MLEMTIDSIRVSMMNYQHVVILKEKNSDRYLPIWIGPSEADAISVKLQNIHLSRPLTHDLLKNTVFALESISGASIRKVVVNDLKADTFYAQIVFEFDEGPVPVIVDLLPTHYKYRETDKDSSVSIVWQGRKYDTRLTGECEDGSKVNLEVANNDGLIFNLFYDASRERWLLTRIKLDSRPSDAIALAVRVTTPIFVEDVVMDKAGIVLDKETGKPLTTSKEESDKKGGTPKVDDKEMKKLSAFYDFINTLDLDDLGKRQS
jgi:bifunctional DNase/RNase